MANFDTYRWQRLSTLAVVVAATLCVARPAAAQSLEESLSTLGPENAEGYIVPLTAGLAATLNTGFFHRAATHDVGGFDIGILAMGSWVPSTAGTFVPTLPDAFELNGQTFEDPYAPAPGYSLVSPTVAGTDDDLPSARFRALDLARLWSSRRLTVASWPPVHVAVFRP